MTIVKSISPPEYRVLCGLAVAVLPTIKWRHSGLGMLQGYVHEGTTDELRIHVWHKSLRRPGIEESGLLHDHRFNLRSFVLVGALTQVEYDLTEDADGDWQLHSVVPARKAFALSGKPDGLVEALPKRYRAKTRDYVIRARERYYFDKFQFHGTHTFTDLVVTVVAKSEQEDAQARILAPFGKPVIHAFDNPLPESAWRPVLAQARETLLQAWQVTP